MMAINLTCALIAIYSFIVAINAEHLYGASVHWRPLSENGRSRSNEIVLSYKLIWQQQYLPQCKVPNTDLLCYFYKDGYKNPTTLIKASFTSRWQGYEWKCTKGCSDVRTISNLSSLYYTDIGTFKNISWEAAVEMVSFEFKANDDMANIEIGFFDSNNTQVEGLAGAKLSMAIRNDTRRANISPAISPLPYYRIPLGCRITIPLFPFDGDGDYVRCHWQRYPSLVSDGSTATLNEDKCEIEFHANSSKGISVGEKITLALYAEDYSFKPVRLSSLSDDITTGPFSRTPFLLFLYVGEPTQSCDPGPDFIEAGTLPPNYVGSYSLPFKNAKLPFKIPINDSQIVLTSGPRYMNFKFDNNVASFQGTWDNVNDINMTGIHQACGMTYTKDGVPGTTRCAVLLVNEPNECPCPQKDNINRECRNLFEYHTCDYTNMSSIQKLETIDQILQTVAEQKRNISQLQQIAEQQMGTCQNSYSDDDDKKLLIGLPVGLSLLLLIIIIVTACIVKHYIDKKKQKKSINPDENTSQINSPPSVW